MYVILDEQLPNEGFSYVSLCHIVIYNAHIYIARPGSSDKNWMYFFLDEQLPNEGFTYVSLCHIVTYNAHISAKNRMFFSSPQDVENEENEKSLFPAAWYDKWMLWSNLYVTQVTRPPLKRN